MRYEPTLEFTKAQDEVGPLEGRRAQHTAPSGGNSATCPSGACRQHSRSGLKKLISFEAPPVGAASSRDRPCDGTPIAAGSRSHGIFETASNIYLPMSSPPAR